MKRHVYGVPTGTPSPRHAEEFYGAGSHGHAVEHDRDDRLVEVRSNRKVPDGRVARGGAGRQRRRRPCLLGLGLRGLGRRRRGLRGLGYGRRRRGRGCGRRRRLHVSTESFVCTGHVGKKRSCRRSLRRSLATVTTSSDGCYALRRERGKGGLRDGKTSVSKYASSKLLSLCTGPVRPVSLREPH